jgi:quercetin dioxygenase-like cupin family protein
MIRQAILLPAMLAFAAPALAAEPIPTRTPLASIPLAAPKTVERVDATRVDFAPSQRMPRHVHPVPVICFAAKGAFKVKFEGQPEFIAAEGSVTYEPADHVVDYFRNASDTAPATLLCAVLAGAADTQTSRMLPEANR